MLKLHREGAFCTIYEQKLKYGSLFSLTNRAGHVIYYPSEEEALHEFEKMEEQKVKDDDDGGD